MAANKKRKNYTNAVTSSRGSNLEVRQTNDGVTVDCVALVHLPDQSPTEPAQPVRHPSPYYYGDLFKVPEPLSRPQPNKYRKSLSLDVPEENSKTPCLRKRNSLAADGSPSSSHHGLCQSQDLVSPTSGSEHAIAPRSEILCSSIITEWDQSLMPPHRLLSHDLPSNVCTCIVSPEDDELEVSKAQVARQKVRKVRRSRKVDPQPILVEDEDDEEGEVEDEEEMARQRQLYETAFDCKVSRSDDDLDELDRVINHPVLHSQVRYLQNNYSCFAL